MSETEENKKKIMFLLATMPGGKIGHKDLYRVLGIGEEAFVQAIQLLLGEYSIEKVKINLYSDYYSGYGLTKSGIERYSLQVTSDSVAESRYIPIPDDRYEKVISQDTQYGATRTGLRLRRSRSEVTKKRRRVTIFICACAGGFILIAVLVLVLTF